ncbi:MAG TPA: cation transporter dimerization domain-containing protein, partial [Smithellaceae bacterium]|nr:cation transporter dimerization domain-containing protein [Smithellaceae bacterium]
IHGVRTRRSGSHTFIEIFLEFASDAKVEEVYRLKDRLEAELKKQMPNAQIMLIPSRLTGNARF